ncbi:MAG: hypothetical protein ABW188_04030 [Rhodococcus fascians]
MHQTAYAVAVERAVAELLQRNPMEVAQIQALALRDLPAGDRRTALMRLRFTMGLSMCPNSRVLVDDAGNSMPVSAVLGSVLVS